MTRASAVKLETPSPVKDHRAISTLAGPTDLPRPISPGERVQEEKAQVLFGGTIRFLAGEEANEHKANC